MLLVGSGLNLSNDGHLNIEKVKKSIRTDFHHGITRTLTSNTWPREIWQGLPITSDTRVGK